MKWFLWLMLLFLCAESVPAQGFHEKTFQPDVLRSDLNFLRKKLEAHHPGLYLYSSKEKLDAVFDSLIRTIDRPMTETEFYFHIAFLNALVCDGHTIMLPSQRYLDETQLAKYFPVNVVAADNRLIATTSGTRDSLIRNGAEILSINGKNASEILQLMRDRLPHDGKNRTYPDWILKQYFRSYYGFMFGHPDTFRVKYRQDGVIRESTIDALGRDSIRYYAALRSAPSNGSSSELPLQFTISSNKKAAVLHIADFHQEVLRAAHQDFDEFVQHAFDSIQKAGIQKLIIDLRNNQGGDLHHGRFLLSQLLDKPFVMIEQYKRKGRGAKLKNAKGPCCGKCMPASRVYSGELVVLINGGSFSNSGIVSACLKRNNRAVFIGEETGGCNTVLNGFTRSVTLPATKITVDVPRKQLQLTSQPEVSGHGTKADISYPIGADEKPITDDEELARAILYLCEH